MTGNQDAAASGATLDSGKGKSEGASIPISDCNTELHQRQAERVLFLVMKTAVNDGTEFISSSALSAVSLIPEHELKPLLDNLDGAHVYVLREVADGRREPQ